jgi:hypothetical protein
MRTFRATKGPFKEGLFLTDDEIEATCVDELQRQGLMPPSPQAIRIERFIEKRFGFSPSYEDLPSGVVGLTRFGAHGPQEIVVSNELEADQSTPAMRRVRTTFAHEVGHALFHAQLFVLGQGQQPFGDWSDKAKPMVLCRDGERRGYQGEWWELHANKAMASLLMPKRLVQAALATITVPAGSLGARVIPNGQRESAVRMLADIFDVNPVVARYRLDAIIPAVSSSQLSL